MDITYGIIGIVVAINRGIIVGVNLGNITIIRGVINGSVATFTW